MATTTVFSVLLLALMVSQINCQRDSISCTVRLQMCTGQFNSPRLLEGMDITGICEIASALRNCLGDCINSAPLTSGMEGAIVGVLDYVCEPSRRSEMREVMRSRCFRDHTLESRVQQFSAECTQIAMEQSHDLIMQAAMSNNDPSVAICPALQHATVCVAQKIGEICGQNVVPVFSELAGIIYRFVIPQYATCFEQVASGHSVVRRAANAFFKFMRK